MKSLSVRVSVVAWGLCLFATIWRASAADGTVIFRNLFLADGVDAPVFAEDGVTRVSGDAWRAQLYAGPTLESLAAVGEPQPFRTGAAAGYWTPSAAPTAIPTVAAGETAYCQARVWEYAFGPTYETAYAAGGAVGVSAIITVKTGGNGEPPALPAALKGLTSFSVGASLRFLRVPTDLVVFIGEPAVFEVQTGSASPVTYQWRFNGADIPGATQPTLVIAAATLAEGGSYQVVARNADLMRVTAPVRLRVLAPPSGATLRFANRFPAGNLDAPVFGPDGVTKLAGPGFLAQLWAGPTPDTLVPATDPRPFGSGADAGYWEPGETWWGTLAGVPPGAAAFAQVRVWEAIPGAAEEPGFDAAVASHRMVGVSDVFGVVTGGAASPVPGLLSGLKSFRVGYLPRILNWQTQYMATAGETVEIVVIPDGTEPLSFRWFHEAQELAGQTGNRLRLERVDFAQAGRYSVSVSNPIGSTASPTTLLTVGLTGHAGTIYFVNHFIAGNVEAPVFDVDGTTRLEGAGWLAQAYGGPSPDTLQAFGEAHPFRTGLGAGYWDTKDAVVEVPGVPPGGTAYVQARVWQSAFGSRFEEALAAGANSGVSKVVAVVTGGAGEPPSFPGNLTALESFKVTGSIRITGQPLGGVVLVGETIRLEVSAVSPRPLRYDWRRNGVPIPGSDVPVLVLANARIEDSGAYTVQVSDDAGSVLSRPAVVTVQAWPARPSIRFSNRVPGVGLDAPVFLDGSMLLSGDRFVAQLFVGATADSLAPIGEPAPFLDGVDAGYWNAGLFPWRELEGVAVGGKVFVQVRVWDGDSAATFDETVARGGWAGKSAVLELTLGPEPAILAGLQSFRLGTLPKPAIAWPAVVRADLHSRVSVVATVDSPLPYTLQWFHDEVAVPGATNATFLLLDVQPEDAGLYTVVATNDLGTGTSAARRLEVVVPTSGGLVRFDNRDAGTGLDAPIFADDGQTRLTGTTNAVQLYAGSTATALVRVGSASAFGTGPNAGYLALPRDIPLDNIPPGGTVFVQLRAWQRPSVQVDRYETARALGLATGVSEVLELRAGGPAAGAARLGGLKSFSLLPPAPVLVFQPEDQLVPIGFPVTLETWVTNTVFVTFRWERELPGGQWFTLLEGPADTFQIPTFAAEDAGTYRVVAFNAGGTAASVPVSLSVSTTERIGNVTGAFELRLAAGSGIVVVQGSTNLVDWQPLMTLTNAPTPLALTEGANVNVHGTRFYRVVAAETGQVVSENTAGFVELKFPPGFSLLSFPLTFADQRMASVLDGVPDGTTVYVFNGTTQEYFINTWEFGEWADPAATVEPGEGYFVLNNSTTTYLITLSGDVSLGTATRTIPAGWTMQSAPFPVDGAVDTDLDVPLSYLDIVVRWDSLRGEMLSYVFLGGGTWLPSQPVIPAGEAFWLYKSKAAIWTLKRPGD